MLEAVGIHRSLNIRYDVDYGQASRRMKCIRGTPKRVSSRRLRAVVVSFLRITDMGKRRAY